LKLVELKKYQAEFLSSEKRFPCMIAAIGSGKTFMLLLKAWEFCEKYPDSLALIVRKEFTDLRDSLMKDFKKYFNCVPDSNKEYHFKNGSVIMFRHGSEMDVLKNLNLSFVGIEQAEEFETDETFTFLRDRLRRQSSPIRQLCIIANARGMNWIWKRFIQGTEIKEVNQETGEYIYTNGEYHTVTANTFANEDNLPPDFIADLRRMETESPNHYKQYVLNSFEELEEDDLLFTLNELNASKNLDVALHDGYGLRIMGFDIARYGNDKCATVCIQQLFATTWQAIHTEQWEKKDLDYTTGRILSTSVRLNSDDSIIDEDGIGAGPLDFLTHGQDKNFQGFRNIPLSRDKNKDYANHRTQYAFELKDMINKGFIKLTQDELIQELTTIRYRYTNDGRKMLIPKEEMRKKGFLSPNLADALIMAVSIINKTQRKQARQYRNFNNYSQEESLYGLAGIR